MTHHHPPSRAHHHSDGGHHDHDESGMADLLDLDARILGGYLEEAAAWVDELTPGNPRTIIDVGAGTGTGSLALARHFTAAGVVAVDKSALMLARLEAAARGEGLDGRLRTVQADLDAGWPAIPSSTDIPDGADLVWAASSLHHVADPDRVLRDIRTALAPGGLLVVLEMDTLPRFLPGDVASGRPGLEQRCHEALARAGWNAHPDWRPHLEAAGFSMAGQRSFSVESNPAPPGAGRYADALLQRMRSTLDGLLPAEDLAILDHLLDGSSPHSPLRRDPVIRSSRTAWAARRP